MLRVLIVALLFFSGGVSQNPDVVRLWSNINAQCSPSGSQDAQFYAYTSLCQAGCLALAAALPGNQGNDACQGGTRCIGRNSSEPVGTAPGYATVNCDEVQPADLSGVKLEVWTDGCCQAPTPTVVGSFAGSLFPFPPSSGQTESEICVPQAPLPSFFLPVPSKKSNCGSLKVVWSPQNGSMSTFQYGNGCAISQLNLDCSGSEIAGGSRSYPTDGNCFGIEADGDLYSVRISFPGLTLNANGTEYCKYKTALSAGQIAGIAVGIGVGAVILVLLLGCCLVKKC